MAKIDSRFSTLADCPPPVPNERILQEEIIKHAREKLQMDVEHYYYVAVVDQIIIKSALLRYLTIYHLSILGKSNFINGIRGIKDVRIHPNYCYTEDGPAPVGIRETTRQSTCYSFPNNSAPYFRI